MSKLVPIVLSLSLLCVGLLLGNDNDRVTPLVKVVDAAEESVVIIKVTKTDSFGQTKEIVASGFFANKHGLIITAAHVIANLESVDVVCKGGKKYNGKVLLADPKRDIGFVRINRDDTKPLPLAKKIILAEPVVAIGHPLNYKYSASPGIVSATDRSIDMPNSGRTIKGIIQTSAPLNPGNSGGPLLNMNGEVCGLIIAIREGAQNIGFAVSAQKIQDDLANLKR